jgi:hypothetical protein
MVEPGAKLQVTVTVFVVPTMMVTAVEQLVPAMVGGGYPPAAPAGTAGDITRKAEPASNATADAIPIRIFAFPINRTYLPSTT